MDQTGDYYSPTEYSYQHDTSWMDTTQSITFENSEQVHALNQVLATEFDTVNDDKQSDVSRQADFALDFDNLDLVDFELDNYFFQS